MALLRVTVVLMWYLIALSSARRTGAEDGEVLEKTNSARCTSRCFSLHMTQLTASFKHLQSDDVLGWCESHRRCSQCLQPCKELWETRRDLPQKPCEKHHECVTSWEFLVSLRSGKQGDCPPPQRAMGFAAACVESCSADKHCSASKKCCSNGCGHTCQAPANLYKGVPLKPRKDILFLEDQQGQLEVRWVSKFNVTIEPVLYILQRRWNHGIHPSEDDASPWHTVVMTMEDRAVLKDIRPHRWYQFRVSAVNSQGTRGFTTPSKHFFSTRDPFPPEAPQSVRAGNETQGTDGSSVGVQILWDPPKEGDLPVHHYKVTCSARHALRPSAQDRKDNARVTQGAVCEMDLQGLLPGTSYLIQVQAISYWGQKRLKSGRAQLTFTTKTTGKLLAFTSQTTGLSSLPATPGPEQTKGQFSNELPSAPHLVNPSSPHNLRLEAAAPHYHNNQLQVKVFWKRRHQETYKDSPTYVLRWYPHVCASNVSQTEKKATVQGTHYVITGLLFACKYRIAVALVAPEGDQRSEAVTAVTTPPCSAVMARGGKALPCAREERPLVSKKVVLRPEKLTAEFHTVNGSLQGLFRWQLSQTAPGQAPIAGFQFSWVQVSSSTMATGGQDTRISQTQIVAPDQRSLTVEWLQPDSVYKLQVQVLSAGGSGLSVARTLHTPPLNTTLL
ncbi:anosmin-1b isoform X1 [Oncorhynchus kisutch]|uniref:anosmin-1b isoform X1 n=1 Tax=Oncorhynchus kisutch TaxID=8019 RepID=UPI0012DDEFE9|nr:anosmin-1-like isoform X1 [Oncorhynchus kisutch]